VLRFSETVPSARVAIGRVGDQLTLKGMLRDGEVGEIEHEARRDEAEIHKIQARRNLEKIKAPPPIPKTEQPKKKSAIDEEIDAMVEAVLTSKSRFKEIKKDPRLKNLTPKERKEFLERLAARLDLGDISAQSEEEDD
jgi:predicted ATP-dependent endonuclease of OLD family